MTEVFCEFALEIAHSLPRMPEGHKCRRVHGHSYRVRVTVTGEMDPRTGMILDYAEIHNIWALRVHARLDHQNINEALDTELTTSEFVAHWIGLAMARAISELVSSDTDRNKPHVTSVELWETARFGARWTNQP